MPQWSQDAERLSHAPRKPLRSPSTNIAAFLGEQLGLLRTAAGYASHEAMAEALLTDRSTVTKIETGARPPNDKLLALWLDACGVAGQFRTVLEGMACTDRLRLGLLQAADAVPLWEVTDPAWSMPWLRRLGIARSLRGLSSCATYAACWHLARTGGGPRAVQPQSPVDAGAAQCCDGGEND